MDAQEKNPLAAGWIVHAELCVAVTEVCVALPQEFFVDTAALRVHEKNRDVDAKVPFVHAGIAVQHEKFQAPDAGPSCVHATDRVQDARNPIVNAKECCVHAACFVVVGKSLVQDTNGFFLDAADFERHGAHANVRDFFVRVLHPVAIVDVACFIAVLSMSNVRNAIASPLTLRGTVRTTRPFARTGVPMQRLKAKHQLHIAQMLVVGRGNDATPAIGVSSGIRIAGVLMSKQEEAGILGGIPASWSGENPWIRLHYFPLRESSP